MKWISLANTADKLRAEMEQIKSLLAPLAAKYNSPFLGRNKVNSEELSR